MFIIHKTSCLYHKSKYISKQTQLPVRCLWPIRTARPVGLGDDCWSSAFLGNCVEARDLFCLASLVWLVVLFTFFLFSTFHPFWDDMKVDKYFSALEPTSFWTPWEWAFWMNKRHILDLGGGRTLHKPPQRSCYLIYSYIGMACTVTCQFLATDFGTSKDSKGFWRGIRRAPTLDSNELRWVFLGPNCGVVVYQERVQ